MTKDRTIHLLRRMLYLFISRPQSLCIGAHEMGLTVTITIQPDRADAARVLGKRGANFTALQTLVTAMASNTRLEFIEPVAGGLGERERFEPAKEWNRDAIKELLEDVLGEIFKVWEIAESEAGITTGFDVEVGPGEALAKVASVGEALNRLWSAMGKANGRLVVVNVVRAASERQPKTAAGRWAGEK